MLSCFLFLFALMRINVYNEKGRAGMTNSELIRLLKKHGCLLIAHNTRHDAYKSPSTGKIFMVGRHPKEEVPKGTLHRILKDAGIRE